MRNLLRGLALGLGLLMAGGSVSAAPMPSKGPNPGWSEMQKMEWYLGDLSKAAATCRFYKKSADLSALAALSPYGRIGLQGTIADGFYGAACQGIGEEADKFLADKAEFVRYFADVYDCRPGENCGGGGIGKLASDHACAQKVNEVLEAVDIKDGDVVNIHISQRTPGTGAMANGPYYQAQIKLNSCAGALWLDMTEHCTVKQRYTRGECQIAGVSGF